MCKKLSPFVDFAYIVLSFIIFFANLLEFLLTQPNVEWYYINAVYYLRGGAMSEKNKERNLLELTDSQLADLVKQGNDNAFEEITRRYKGLVSKLAFQYCTAEYDVCDFTQEGLLGLLSACKTFNGGDGSSFKNYAALCIKRRFISIIRKSKSKSAIPNENIISLDDVELCDKSLANPEELVVSKERLENLLIQMKSNLSQKEISVVYFYLQGLSYNKIAEKTGLSKKSVDNTLQRIKKKLQT